MLFHLLLSFLNGVLSDFLAALPPWTVSFADDQTPGSVGSAVHYVITYIVMWDRFLPIHDCLIPILLLQLLIAASLLAFKVFFKTASFIPTINAGG